MTAINRRIFTAVVASVAMYSLGSAAAEFPERPITVVVPYAAGGAGYTTMRLLAPIIERELGQPLIIEARPGGGGTIGAQAVAKAKPDGYTLLFGATNNFAINQFMFPKIAFDPLASFALITKAVDIPSVLYTNPKVPAKTLGEFIAYAKANAGKLSYASPSVGTTPHLAVERLKQLTGIELVHIPYRGAPPALQAIIANDVQLYLAGWGVGRAQVEAGRVRALGVASAKPLANIALPIAAASVPGFTASNWWGLAAPKGTPQPVIDRIYRAFSAALNDAGVRQKLDKLGFVPVGNTPAEFAKEAKAEADIWAQTVKQGNLAVQ